MNLKSKVATFAAASIFALSIGSGALADEAGPKVTQEITGGKFTYSLTGGTMEEITFDYTQTRDYVTNGALTLTVNDARGTKQGWTVAITAGAFVYDGDAPGNNDIPATSFSVTPGDPTEDAGEGLTNVTPGRGGTLDDAQTVLSAEVGSGSGAYSQNLPVTLTVPATSPTGTYTATLTVETNTAPGQ